MPIFLIPYWIFGVKFLRVYSKWNWKVNGKIFGVLIYNKLVFYSATTPFLIFFEWQVFPFSFLDFFDPTQRYSLASHFMQLEMKFHPVYNASALTGNEIHVWVKGLKNSSG